MLKMKEIGIIRDVDNPGRIVIPKELRDFYKLQGSIEIISTVDGILIRNPKYTMVEKSLLDSLIKNPKNTKEIAE